MLTIYIILINSFLFPNLINMNIKTINTKKTNIIMGFEEYNDFDVNGFPINNSNSNINFNLEQEIDDSNNNFPSFYEFLRKRELDEINKKSNYLKKSDKNYEKYKEHEIMPTSKDLKLLTSFSTIEWAKTWIYEMIHVPDFFPTFMYQDMFKIRDFGQKNTTKEFFYIGYFPDDVNLRKGPYYIGAFELIPKTREFKTHIIIQNPTYCIVNNYDENKIKNFKKELMALCNDSMVFFKFSNLKDSNDQRYYYSWLYEDN